MKSLNRLVSAALVFALLVSNVLAASVGEIPQATMLGRLGGTGEGPPLAVPLSASSLTDGNTGTGPLVHNHGGSFVDFNGWTPQFAIRDDSAVSAAGTGNAVGDILTLNAGCSTNPSVKVASVSSGGVTGITVNNKGLCAAVPANPVSVLSTTGVGTGTTFNLTWSPAPPWGYGTQTSPFVAGAPACGWRENMAIGPASAATGTQTVMIGPAFMMACKGSAWISSLMQANPGGLLLNNVGEGGFGTFAFQNMLDITAHSGTNCVSPCVSKVTSSATVTVTAASPTVVTWTAHGLLATQAVAFHTTGTMPSGIDGSGAVTYYVCNSAITTNTFKLSSTLALALAGTCDINASTTGTGTLTAANGQLGGLDPGDPLGALQANTDYMEFVVANDGPPPNNWGVVLSCHSGAGCGSPTSGPSETVLAQYPYYLPVMWLRTNGSATALAYKTQKFNYTWSVANSTGPIIALVGTAIKWTALPFVGLSDPNTAVYFVSLEGETAGAAIQVASDSAAPNGGCVLNSATPVAGFPGPTINCMLAPITGQPVVHSTDGSGHVGYIGGLSNW